MNTPVVHHPIHQWIPILLFSLGQIGGGIYFVGSTSSELKSMSISIDKLSAKVDVLIDKNSEIEKLNARSQGEIKAHGEELGRQDRRLERLEQRK